MLRRSNSKPKPTSQPEQDLSSTDILPNQTTHKLELRWWKSILTNNSDSDESSPNATTYDRNLLELTARRYGSGNIHMTLNIFS